MADTGTVSATERLTIDAMPADVAQVTTTLQSYREADQKVQQLMQIAPKCAELKDLHSTLQQIIETISAPLNRSQPAFVSSFAKDSFRIHNAPPPIDLSAVTPNQVEEQIVAIQQRAAVSGAGPVVWAFGARCQVALPPDNAVEEVIVRNVSSQGVCMVQSVKSAPQTFLAREPLDPAELVEVDLADLTLISPAAGAFWSPKQSASYDPTLPANPTSWSSDQQKEAQQAAAAVQVNALAAAVQANMSSYTFPPGVYRIQNKIELDGTENFTLVMANVELIAEEAGHFRLMGNKNLTIRGPLALDADPFRASQSVVVSNDNKTMVEVQVMQGYPPPEAKRVMIFNKQGIRLPSEQVAPEKVNDLGNGHYQLQFRDRDLEIGLAGAMQPGNFISHENYPGGVELRVNHGVTFEKVNAYGGGSVWGIGQKGLLQFKRFRSMRRPGTNRLIGGGNCYQIQFEGGSFVMDHSEVGYNWDDLSDLYSMIGWTAGNGQTDDTIWASGEEWQPGAELSLYNGSSLELLATAKIVSFESGVKNDTAKEIINKAFEAAGMRLQTTDLNLVTLDRPVPVSNLTLLDCAGVEPQSLSVTNSYFHDGLNSGINAKGGRDIVVANNWVERVGVGISSGEDYWWGEGGIPGNVTYRCNTLYNTCFTPDPGDGASISVYASGTNSTPTGLPIKSADISGNQIIQPRTKRPIQIGQTKDARLWGNLPVGGTD